MKKRITIILVAMFVASSVSALELTSPDIESGATLNDKQVFNGFGCSGDNISPALAWDDVPKGTKSFALMVYDPDAPTGSGWWHWVAFNIPADARTLAAGAGTITAGLMPDGVIQGRTDFGTAGYGGACPPAGHGQHRYQFRLFALSVESLPLGEKASAAMVGYMVQQNALESAVIEAVYQR